MMMIFNTLLVLAILTTTAYSANENSFKSLDHSSNDDLSFTFFSEFDEIEDSRSNPSKIYQPSMGMEELLKMNDRITQTEGDFTDFVPEDLKDFMSYLTTGRLLSNTHFLNHLADEITRSVDNSNNNVYSKLLDNMSDQCHNDMDQLFNAITSPLVWNIYNKVLCEGILPRRYCNVAAKRGVRALFPQTPLTDWALASK